MKRFTMSSAELGPHLEAALLGDEVNAVVRANHGLLSVGETLAGAFKVAVAVESNAHVLWGRCSSARRGCPSSTRS